MFRLFANSFLIAAAATICLAQPSAAEPVPDRAAFVAGLFSGAEQYENFNRIDQLFRTDPVAASNRPKPLQKGSERPIPPAFSFSGKQRSSEEFLTSTDTSALLVLHDGKIVHESYRLTGGPEVRWLSMSVAKSVVSALVGAALTDGKIRSINDPVTDYLPDLRGSAYDGVSIKNILQMSSGARWREDYSAGESDVFRLGQLLATGGSVQSFPATLERAREPGTFFLYNSADTLVLGLLVEKITGKRLAQYTQEKLWEPLGATTSAYWLTDDEGAAHAYMGFNATARDYARIGELYRNNGMFGGKRILPADWVRASVTSDAPHLRPGTGTADNDDWGYGYQWWLPGGSSPEAFSAVGVYNQFVYVDPQSKVVIVKLSANSAYGQDTEEASDREAETFAFFRAITAAI